MKTLEELLQELGCEGSAFDSTGEFTKAGEKAGKETISPKPANIN